MFILNPDQYLLPDYKISPFQTEDIGSNALLRNNNTIDTYFKDRFKNRAFTYTVNGRSALHKAVAYYKLQKGDTVTILTTSGNFYVSSCVTGEVEKFCFWNREIIPTTKVIIVVHEFGYPYKGMTELAKLNIPIIEDCAYAFFSEDSDRTIGNTGNFCVYSFPKMFPIQMGGLLTYHQDAKIENEQWPQAGMEQYIRNVLSSQIKKKDEITQKRLQHSQWLRLALQSLGFEERFPLQQGVIPGVYMFRVSNEELSLPALKQYLFNHGIQCSVFYGERAFFIPNHQALRESDLYYFISVIQSFVKSTT
jgi:hypothetical protein